MNDALVEAHRLLAHFELRLGRHESVLVRLEPLLHVHHLDEGLAQHWITALCAAGRENDARSFQTEFRRRFRREIGADSTVELPNGGVGDHRGRVRNSTPVRTGPASVPDGTTPHRVGPRQLPKDIYDFTGHADVLTELDALTDPVGNTRANIVVISGMPGVGKTTLATHWAHQRRPRFPDGQLYLNANAFGELPGVDPEEALGRFLQALDVPADRIPQGVEQRLDRLNRVLAGRRVLILLDNVRDSGQVRPLLTESDTCVTLITSRRRLRGLNIREAVPILTLEPLPEDASLVLLRKVIGQTRADGDPGTSRALARLSGGLPLALRIIGERVAERPRASMADLAEQLGGCLFDSAAEDDEADLRTVFAWSYAALPPASARLFRLIGLHPGATIGVEAAAALAGAGREETRALLDGLAKAHLINHDTANRYRFHDLLRLYAADRARHTETDAERRDAVRRLLDWYLLSAANATGVLAPGSEPAPDLPAPHGVEPQTFDTDAEAMRWYEDERPNLVRVVQWAAANGFHRHGWQLPGTVHEVIDRYGRQDDVLELLQAALTAARADGHQQGQIGILNNLGAAYFALHDYDRAKATFDAGYRLAQETGFREAELICWHNVATVLLKTGDAGTAIRIFEQLLAARRAASDAGGAAAELHRLGDAHRQQGDHAVAATHFREALRIRTELGSLRARGATHTELAALYLETGDPHKALEHCRVALEMHGRTRDQAAECGTLSTMADALRELGRSEDAVAVAERAVALSEEIGDSSRLCRALAALASALGAAGRTGSARVACARVLRVIDEVTDPEAKALRAGMVALRDSLSPVGAWSGGGTPGGAGPARRGR